jgi:hypothetical protein
VRQFAVRAGLIDRERKLVGQYLGDLIDGDILFGGELPNDVAAEYLFQLISCDRQVLTGSDPGFGDPAESRLLQLGDDRIEAALLAAAHDLAQYGRKHGGAKLAEDARTFQ